MSNYLSTRKKNFTMTEFRAIPRNSDGDIIDLFDAYPFITGMQRLLLTDDDWSRMDEYDEEVRCMMEEFY
ncbi:MAG: hypothetical protein ACO3S3_11675 [Pseudohongiellaceae bacterium]